MFSGLSTVFLSQGDAKALSITDRSFSDVKSDTPNQSVLAPTNVPMNDVGSAGPSRDVGSKQPETDKPSDKDGKLVFPKDPSSFGSLFDYVRARDAWIDANLTESQRAERAKLAAEDKDREQLRNVERDIARGRSGVILPDDQTREPVLAQRNIISDDSIVYGTPTPETKEPSMLVFADPLSKKLDAIVELDSVPASSSSSDDEVFETRITPLSDFKREIADMVSKSINDAKKGGVSHLLPRSALISLYDHEYSDYVEKFNEAIQYARSSLHREFTDLKLFDAKAEFWRYAPTAPGDPKMVLPGLHRNVCFLAIVAAATEATGRGVITSFDETTGYTGFGPGRHSVDVDSLPELLLPTEDFNQTVSQNFRLFTEEHPILGFRFGLNAIPFSITPFGEMVTECVKITCRDLRELKATSSIPDYSTPLKSELMSKVLLNMKASSIELTQEEMHFKIAEFFLIYRIDSKERLRAYSEWFNNMIEKMPTATESITARLNDLVSNVLLDVKKVNIDLISISATLEQFPYFSGPFFESLMSIYDPADTRPYFTPGSVPYLNRTFEGHTDSGESDLWSDEEDGFDVFSDPNGIRIALVTDKLLNEFRKEGNINIVSPRNPGIASAGERVFFITDKSNLAAGTIYHVQPIRCADPESKLPPSFNATTLVPVHFVSDRRARPSLLNPVNAECISHTRYIYHIEKGINPIRLSHQDRAKLLNLLDYVRHFFVGERIHIRPSDSTNVATILSSGNHDDTDQKFIPASVPLPVIFRAPGLVDPTFGRDQAWTVLFRDKKIVLRGYIDNPPKKSKKSVILVDLDDPVLRGKQVLQYPISDGKTIFVNEFRSSLGSIPRRYIDLRTHSALSLKFGDELCKKAVDLFTTKKSVFLIAGSSSISHLSGNIYTIGTLPHFAPRYSGLFLVTDIFAKLSAPLAILDVGATPFGKPLSLFAATNVPAPKDIYFSLMRVYGTLQGCFSEGSVMFIYLLAFLSTPDDSTCPMLRFLFKELPFGVNCLMPIPELFNFAKQVMHASGRSPLAMARCFYSRAEAARLNVAGDMTQHPLLGLQQEFRFKTLLLCCLLNLSDISLDIASEDTPIPRVHINGGNVMGQRELRLSMLMSLLSAYYDRPFVWSLKFDFLESFFTAGLFNISVLDYEDLLFTEEDFKLLRSTRPNSNQMRLMMDPRGRRMRFVYCAYCSSLCTGRHGVTKQPVCPNHDGIAPTGGLPYRSFSRVRNLSSFVAQWLDEMKWNVGLGINFCVEEMKFIQSHPNVNFSEIFHNEMRSTNFWAGCETCVPPIRDRTPELKRVHRASSAPDSINNFILSLRFDGCDYFPKQCASAMSPETLFLLTAVAHSYDEAARDPDSGSDNEIEDLMAHGNFWSG